MRRTDYPLFKNPLLYQWQNRGIQWTPFVRLRIIPGYSVSSNQESGETMQILQGFFRYSGGESFIFSRCQSHGVEASTRTEETQMLHLITFLARCNTPLLHLATFLLLCNTSVLHNKTIFFKRYKHIPNVSKNGNGPIRSL